MINLVIKLFGGKIVNNAATWTITTVTLGVTQVLSYLAHHGLAWLTNGWDAKTISHVVLVSIIGATINHLGNLGNSPVNKIEQQVASTIIKKA